MIFIINAEYIFCIMIMIEKKFGDVLMSRPAGKDAFLLAESHLFSSLNTMGTFNFFNPNTKPKEEKYNGQIRKVADEKNPGMMVTFEGE